MTSILTCNESQKFTMHYYVSNCSSYNNYRCATSNKPSSWKRHQPINKHGHLSGHSFVQRFRSTEDISSRRQNSTAYFLSCSYWMMLGRTWKRFLFLFFTFVHLFIIFFWDTSSSFLMRNHHHQHGPGNVQLDNMAFTSLQLQDCTFFFFLISLALNLATR